MLHSWSARSGLRRVGVPALLLFVSSAIAADAAPLRLQLDNGIVARVHGPEEILAERTVKRGAQLLFVPRPGLEYRFVTDPADPVILNRGDGQFHPMPVQDVVAALRSVRLNAMGLDLDVYVLPYPRREVLDSSAREGMILLSPGMRPVSEHAVHFTVTHEVGHVFQYRWLPDTDHVGWSEYHHRRGTSDPRIYRAEGAHRNRPHEIFAEDFRFLFGGLLSTYSGSIENDDLVLPNAVAGLEEFMRSLPGRNPILAAASISTTPNPFNPATSVRVEFGVLPTSTARVAIFSAAGQRLQTLYEGIPSSRNLELAWDGRSGAGNRAASGIYFARLDHAGGSISTKLVLVE